MVWVGERGVRQYAIGSARTLDKILNRIRK